MYISHPLSDCLCSLFIYPSIDMDIQEMKDVEKQLSQTRQYGVGVMDINQPHVAYHIQFLKNILGSLSGEEEEEEDDDNIYIYISYTHNADANTLIYKL